MLVIKAYQWDELVMIWEVNKERANELKLKDVITLLRQNLADVKVKAEYQA